MHIGICWQYFQFFQLRTIGSIFGNVHIKIFSAPPTTITTITKRDYYSGLDMDWDPNPEPEQKKMKNNKRKNAKEKKKKRFFKKARRKP